VGIKLAMDSSCGVSTIPKVLCKFVERFERSGVGFGGVDPRLLFIPKRSDRCVTGLTGVCDLSDRCMPLV
jgi:hypothetical protein